MTHSFGLRYDQVCGLPTVVECLQMPGALLALELAGVHDG